MRPACNLSLYLVTDRRLLEGRAIDRVVAEAIDGGVTMVQLREKHCETKAFVHLADSLQAVTSRHAVPLMINDRMDVALAVGAAGVHLGQQDLPVAVARKHLGADALIGISVGSLEEAKAANTLDIDYIGISPVFHTHTKTDITAPVGLEGVGQIGAASRFPAVAIGGINTTNARAVVAAGAQGVAVVSAIMAAPDPRLAAATLLHEVNVNG